MSNLTHHRHPAIARRCAWALCLMVSACGCVSVPGFSGLFRKYPVADAQHPIVELMGIWQAGEGRTPDGLPCRGFAGQLLFMVAGDPLSAQVNGGIKVYVFDDVGNPHEQARPIDVFEFTPEQFQTFGHPTKLGMTYQLFIPYRRTGIETRDCAVRVKFMPANGTTPLYSQTASITLPGKTPASANHEPDEGTISGLGAVNPSVGSAFNELASKIKADAAMSQGELARSATPISSSAIPTGRQPGVTPVEIQRLQALLDGSESEAVTPAVHYEPVADAAEASQRRSRGPRPPLKPANTGRYD
jgi:hypothetical protein